MTSFGVRAHKYGSPIVSRAQLSIINFPVLLLKTELEKFACEREPVWYYKVKNKITVTIFKNDSFEAYFDFLVRPKSFLT